MWGHYGIYREGKYSSLLFYMPLGLSSPGNASATLESWEISINL